MIFTIRSNILFRFVCAFFPPRMDASFLIFFSTYIFFSFSSLFLPLLFYFFNVFIHWFALRFQHFVRSQAFVSPMVRSCLAVMDMLGVLPTRLLFFVCLFFPWIRESLDQVRDLGFHVMVTANAEGLLWTQHGAGLAATLGSEVVAVDRMDDDEVRMIRCIKY